MLDIPTIQAECQPGFRMRSVLPVCGFLWEKLPRMFFFTAWLWLTFTPCSVGYVSVCPSLPGGFCVPAFLWASHASVAVIFRTLPGLPLIFFPFIYLFFFFCKSLAIFAAINCIWRELKAFNCVCLPVLPRLPWEWTATIRHLDEWLLLMISTPHHANEKVKDFGDVFFLVPEA